MTTAPRSRATALHEHLRALVERGDRGALAALRRGLGKPPGTVPEMYRHVEPYLGDARRPQTDAAYLVASLFGLHSVPWKPPENAPWNTSFGWTMRRIRVRGDGSDDEGVNRRFEAALSCEGEALSTHLRQLLSLLHSRDATAPVDWERFFWDIVDWERIDRRAQRRWAEAFWRGADGGASGEAPPPDRTED